MNDALANYIHLPSLHQQKLNANKYPSMCIYPVFSSNATEILNDERREISLYLRGSQVKESNKMFPLLNTLNTLSQPL